MPPSVYYFSPLDYTGWATLPIPQNLVNTRGTYGSTSLQASIKRDPKIELNQMPGNNYCVLGMLSYNLDLLHLEIGIILPVLEHT